MSSTEPQRWRSACADTVRRVWDCGAVRLWGCGAVGWDRAVVAQNLCGDPKHCLLCGWGWVV